MKRLSLKKHIVIGILLGLIACCNKAISQPVFKAYYTKIEQGEDWEDISRTTEHPDIKIELDNGAFIFWRGTSYLPYWETSAGTFAVKEIVKRSGDGPQSRPDNVNMFSYVRIISADSAKAVIHWRYLPIFNGGNPKQDVDHLEFIEEYYTIYKDGSVMRTIKKGSPKVTDWEDNSNVTLQKFNLTKEGIEYSETLNPEPTLHPELVNTNPVLGPVIKSPVTYFDFDGMLPSEAIEKVSSNKYPVQGPKSYWKAGVSGTALAFDGYNSGITISKDDVPELSDFTIDVWVALGAYPYNWSPIVHQSEWGQSGFYLGVDPHGKVGVKLKSGSWQEITTEYVLSVRRWTHIAVTYNGKEIIIYVNGNPEATLALSEVIEFSDSDLLIGLNNEPMEPATAVRPYCEECHTPAIFGIDALIDELKIYNRAFTEAQITESFHNFLPDEDITYNPDLEERNLPTGLTTGNFEAHYTKLHYYDTWDNLAHFGDHADIVVEFSETPVKFVFWRGMSYIPQVVNPEQQWYNNQFNESWDKDGSWGEPMSDKKSNISHVRLIENTPARKVIHWRYAQVQINGTQQNYNKKTGWGDWSDWYYYIYPDGVACKRMVHWSYDNPLEHEWQESIGVMQPGEAPESICDIYNNTITLADYSISKSYDWSYPYNPYPELDEYWEKNELKIQQVNYNSDFKPYTIGDFKSAGLYWDVDDGTAPYSNMVVYTHWPLGQLPSDGIYAVKPDRASSNGYTHLSIKGAHKKGEFWAERLLLEGMNTMIVDELRVLAKSWLEAPELKNVSGATNAHFDQSQRAYVFNKKEIDISFSIIASANNPLHNPAFVIKNWNDTASASVYINSKPISDFSQGLVYDTEGNPTMIIYVPFSAVAPTRIMIKKELPITKTVFVLSTGILGKGNGTIKLEPGGGVYEQGTGVTLTAISEDSTEFKGWSGFSSNKSNELKINMNQNIHLNAIFQSISDANKVTKLDINNEIVLFSNQKKDIIKILIDNDDFSVTIINSKGQNVISSKNETEIDISKLEIGMYLIELNIKETSYNYKFYKEQSSKKISKYGNHIY